MKKFTLSILVMSALGTLAGPPASAAHCDDRMVIFSQPLSVNSNVAVCAAGVEEAGDTRLINPGSSGVQVRFLDDFGPSLPVLDAIVDGLGYQAKVIRLTRTAVPIGPTTTFVYDSKTLPIVRTDIGCIRVVLSDIDLGGGNIVSGADAGQTAFHTVGGSC